MFADAHSYLSCCYVDAWLFQWPGFDEGLSCGLEWAQKGVALDPGSAIAQTRLGWNQFFLVQYDEAVESFERALALDPDSAEAHAYYGETLNYCGDPQTAMEHIDTALRLDPFCPPSWLFMKGHSLYLLGQYDDAIPLMQATVERIPDFQVGHLFLACIYAETNRPGEASHHVNEVLRSVPQYTLADAVRVYRYRGEKQKQKFITGLRKAGLPE